MIVVGIESSCDETACGVVRDGRVVLSSVVASQIESHKIFGGVVPEIASREHLAAVRPVVERALQAAEVTASQIDAIAVTQGPGLVGALLVGASFSKGMAAALDVPLLPVNHVHAHIHGALLDQKTVAYPCLALVASGGHTNLYLMNDSVSFELLARTADDAVGECFDKVAKLLNLGYPGGPKVENAARDGRPVVAMPIGVLEKQKMMFSYSGLKTFVANLVRGKSSDWIAEHQSDLCASFQHVAFEQIIRKLQVAVERNPDIRCLLVAGGVAANQTLRRLLEQRLKVELRFPSLKYCSDNGAMIASMGFYNWQQNPDPSAWRWHSDWDVFSRYRFA